MKRLPPGASMGVALVAAIALVASTAALLHHPTRTVIERSVVHDTPSSVVVTIPGGERVVLVPQPDGSVKATPVPATTTAAKTVAAPTTSTTSTTPPTTSCPGVTVPMNGTCVTVPPNLR